MIIKDSKCWEANMWWSQSQLLLSQHVSSKGLIFQYSNWWLLFVCATQFVVFYCIQILVLVLPISANKKLWLFLCFRRFCRSGFRLGSFGLRCLSQQVKFDWFGLEFWKISDTPKSNHFGHIWINLGWIIDLILK